MNEKPARLTVLVNPSSKADFEAQCEKMGVNPSVVLRELIAQFIQGERQDTRNPPTADGNNAGPGKGRAH